MEFRFFICFIIPIKMYLMTAGQGLVWCLKEDFELRHSSFSPGIIPVSMFS